jgi:hypothetical protein
MDFTDDKLWAEAAAANDALEALEQAKRLAARRLALHRRGDSAAQRTQGRGRQPSIVAIGGNTLYVGDTAADGRTPEGYGSLHLLDGSQHLGEFQAGRAHGPGCWLSARGESVIGSWAANRRSGRFVAVDADGRVFGETYSAEGRLIARVLQADGVPPDRCARCGHHFVSALNHPLGCRAHAAAYVEMEVDAADGRPKRGLYRAQLGPEDLRRRAPAAQPRAAMAPREERSSSCGDERATGGRGVWPCCGQRERGAPGCAFEPHRATNERLPVRCAKAECRSGRHAQSTVAAAGRGKERDPHHAGHGAGHGVPAEGRAAIRPIGRLGTRPQSGPRNW